MSPFRQNATAVHSDVSRTIGCRGWCSTACVRESLVEKMQKGRLRPRPSCVEASLCLRRAHVCRTRRSLISGRSRRMPPMGEVKRADQPLDGGRINYTRPPMVGVGVEGSMRRSPPRLETSHGQSRGGSAGEIGDSLEPPAANENPNRNSGVHRFARRVPTACECIVETVDARTIEVRVAAGSLAARHEPVELEGCLLVWHAMHPDGRVERLTPPAA